MRFAVSPHLHSSSHRTTQHPPQSPHITHIRHNQHSRRPKGPVIRPFNLSHHARALRCPDPDTRSSHTIITHSSFRILGHNSSIRSDNAPEDPPEDTDARTDSLNQHSRRPKGQVIRPFNLSHHARALRRPDWRGLAPFYRGDNNIHDVW